MPQADERNITRRSLIATAVALTAVVTQIPTAAAPRNHPSPDEGPLRADDVTGTTAYADWEREWYARRAAQS